MAVTVLLSGCAAHGDENHPPSQVTVFAAASLTDVFEELSHAFTAENPGITVKTVYDGSSTLAAQLTEGASADVFASADPATMDRVVKAGLVHGTPQPFATNTLEIAVAPGNPHGVKGLNDLGDANLAVVTCAAQVPCGAASVAVLARAGVDLIPVSEEQNVKAVVTKVALGEADAGLVYTTDVRAAGGRIDGVAIDGAGSVANRYLIGRLAPATDDGTTATADAFVRFVLSAPGQTLLADAGFGAP